MGHHFLPLTRQTALGRWPSQTCLLAVHRQPSMLQTPKGTVYTLKTVAFIVGKSENPAAPKKFYSFFH